MEAMFADAGAQIGTALGLAAPVPANAVAACAAVLLLSLLGALTGAFGKKGLPPVVSGLPLIGGFLKFVDGPINLMRNAYPKYGQVFTVPVLHKKITFLLGPEVSSHFFKATDLQLSQKEVYEFNVPTFGKGVVFDVDHQVRNEQFRFFAESLKVGKMRTYVSMMVQEAEDFFESWPESGEVDLLQKLSELIILTASRCLMGKECRENLFQDVYRLFHDLDHGMQPISVLFPYLPIEAHRKRDASRQELSELFTKVIRNRRDKGISEPDALQAFMDARYKNGDQLTEDQICGMLIAVLFAGQHTSSITSTWTGLHMMTNPDIWKRAEQEQRDVLKKHGDKLDYDILQEMDHLHRCMKEALRLHPPLIMLMRMTQEAFSVTDRHGKSYNIPKGHIVATSPTFAHTLEHVFKEPKKFDPDRFAEPRMEDKKQPFSYIGFGGGRHGCMGELFAFMQVKTIWSVLLRKFEFELISDFPTPNFDAMVVGPKGDSKVKFKRRAL